MVELSSDTNRPVQVRRSCSTVVRGLLGISLLGTVLPQLRADDASSVQVTSTCEIQPTTPVPGTLFICGGGIMPPTIMHRFFQLAGGEKARVIVVTSASSLAGTPELAEKYAAWKQFPHASIDLFHAPTHTEANSTEFCEKLLSASAIWFAGGNQSLLTDAYLGTYAAKMFHEVLARGGVIGGTSAGAAIMSQVMIAGGRNEPMMSTGLGFLPGTVIDQHFSNRGRQERLKKALELRPGHVGIGIDESTALIVQGRTIEVMGEAGVSMFLAQSPHRQSTSLRLASGARDDLIKYSRAAIERTKQEFPLARKQVPEVKAGTLVIVGGGKTPREAVEKFLSAAGGNDSPIVVVSNALGDHPPEEKDVCGWLKEAGASNVRQLHTRDKRDLNHPDLLTWLSEAKGIWFTGGGQWRLVDAYLDTPIQKLFHGVLRRGGVIGGTSAGAAIQGEFLVRGNPLGNQDVMTEGYDRGFGFLPGVAIDQQFRQLDRFEDMNILKRAHPQLVGIGIDESTALIMSGTTMEVVGQNQVAVYDRTTGTEDQSPVYEVIRAGQKYDFKKQQLMEQVAFEMK